MEMHEEAVLWCVLHACLLACLLARSAMVTLTGHCLITLQPAD